MSTRESINEENHEEYIEEDSEVSGRCYRLLKVGYEKCRQEVYNVKRKLELKTAMLREVREANEMLERSLNRRTSEEERIISEAKEKHRVTVEEYENVISNLETKLAKQTTEVEELRRYVDRRDEIVRETVKDQLANISLEVNDASLQNRIDELVTLLLEEEKKSEHAEETIREIQARCDEFERIARHTKEQLDEKNKILEDIHSEQILKHAKSASLEIDSTRDLRKGNSLFAEVEDRRRNAVDKMNVLREKYTEVKRTCKAQMAEIKMLKAERVAILKKWEDDVNHTLVDNDQLIQKYKHRISDLENKLKSEIKKSSDTKQLNSIEVCSRYLQSVLDAKKKEIGELCVKIENLSTQLLVQEETKMNITKQLQYWQCKASSLEAQICALRTKIQFDLADDSKRNIFLKEFNDFGRAYDNDETSSKSGTASCSSKDKTDEDRIVRRTRNTRNTNYSDTDEKKAYRFVVREPENSNGE